MKKRLTAILSLLCLLLLTGINHAQENSLKGIKLGFGFDQGLGLTASLGKLNGFIGNDGVAIDYVLKKQPLKTDIKGPLYWYIAGGGYGEWDGDFGARLPVGIEWYFAQNLDLYFQLIPKLQVADEFRFGFDGAIGMRYQF